MQDNEKLPLANEHAQINPELEQVAKKIEQIKNEISKVIVGQDEVLELLIAGLLTGGHILLEGVPGIAKTLTAKLLARSVSVDFSRIQFTPDLMPTDVTGTTVFNLKTSEFTFNRGPVFSNIVLIDEINRAPAKTQAALFEVMEELQITIDGTSHILTEPFMVIATQNPVEQEGTYKLPEAQLDRFLFRIKMGYPSYAEEVSILQRFKEGASKDHEVNIQSVISAAEFSTCKKAIQLVHVKDELIEYIAQIVQATRTSADLYLGASPRASLAIMRAAKTIAVINSRDFVIPEDIQRVTYPVLNHRIILTPEREMEGIASEEVIREIIQYIEVPR